MTTVTTTVEQITPAKAQEYLTRNIANRRVREAIVGVYADQMKKGLWRLSNDAICFTKSGKLINGQHRMMAVCKSGIDCKFNVSRGYDEDDIMVMDNGISRSSGDVLFLQGVENANTVSGIVKRRLVLGRHIVAITNGDGGGLYSGSSKILNSAVNEEFYAHDVLYKDITKIAKNAYSKLRILSASEYGGIAAHLILDKNYSISQVKQFLEELCGQKPDSNNATALLRTKLINDKMQNAKMSAVMKQKLIIKAWNAFITGKSVKVLSYNEINDKDIWFV